MLVSFVIPCYRSEKTISNVIKEIKQSIDRRLGYTYEIILVNDNSPDNLLDILYKLAIDDKNIKIIDLAKNFGQHSALMAGYGHAKGDIVVSLDDDGQTPANEVFKLIDKLNEGYDVVFAKYSSKKHSIFRNFGSKVNDIMARILIDKPKDLYLSSYFVAKDFIMKEIIRYKNSYPYVSGLLLRSSNNIANVNVNHRNREIGDSGYNLKNLIKLWVNGFTAFSVKPLRISILIGIIFAILGFLIGLYTIINKFLNPNVPIGWTSTMATLTLIGGIILVILGMIGEYVGRIYISINNSPQYVIREKINIEEDVYEYEAKCTR